MWFRNETTLLVLWQPPYPPGVYLHYKVSIDPPDAVESVLYVEKEGEPPGPAQAAFKGLVPGKELSKFIKFFSPLHLPWNGILEGMFLTILIFRASIQHLCADCK